jgi:hypothetical protein
LAEGHTVKRACVLCRVPQTTYYDWRKNDEAFRKKVDEIVDDDETKARADYLLACGGRALESGWEERFYLNYAKTRSRVAAAFSAGIAATRVAELLDPEHADYNDDFARMVKEVELRVLWEIEDTELTKSLSESRSAQFVLQSRMKEKYGKSPFGDSSQVNNFWFTDGGEAGAAGFVNRLFGENDRSSGNQSADKPVRLLEAGSSDKSSS